jgi:hypothetical protein
MCRTSIEHRNTPNDRGVCASKSILLDLNFFLEEVIQISWQQCFPWRVQ